MRLHAPLYMALAALLPVACSGDLAKDGGAPASTLPATTVAASDAGRRSQPYWVPVTAFSGTGNMTTPTFTIATNAIQWRVSWTCQSAPFTVVSTDGAGKESTRKLANALTCPKEAEGFSAEQGLHSLKVVTGGDWKIEVYQQVDTPLVEPPFSGMGSAPLLASGAMYKIDRDAEGTAKIYLLDDGSRVLRLEDFYVSPNSDLEVRFSVSSAPTSTDEVARATFTAIAPLKATVGTMNYTLPRTLKLDEFGSIVIWCEITRNAYAAAKITLF